MVAARDSRRPSTVNSAINCARPSVAWSLDSTFESIPAVMTLHALHSHSNSKRLITFRNQKYFLLVSDSLLVSVRTFTRQESNNLKRRKVSDYFTLPLLLSLAFSLANLLRVNELLMRLPCPQILTPSTRIDVLFKPAYSLIAVIVIEPTFWRGLSVITNEVGNAN